MFGAICGDIIGSIYEIENIKSKDFPLFDVNSRFTDDSVMTCAVANASIKYFYNKNFDLFKKNCIDNMQKLGRNHINAGYGGTFIRWLMVNNPKPYNSFGNGSAMRVSSVAYVAESLEEAETLAEISACVSHNHPEGIKGAKAIAGAIWLLLNKKNKEQVKDYIEKKYYKLDFCISEIRDDYKFDVTCQGSVPQAIQCFLESESFEDSIRIAISLGGDSDTIAAITGSLSEAYYGIPENIKNCALSYLDSELLLSLQQFYSLIDNKRKTDAKINGRICK